LLDTFHVARMTLWERAARIIVDSMTIEASQIVVERPGIVDYQEAWDHQRALQQQRIDDQIGDTVVLLEHPSVYTAGRRTEPWALPQDGTPVVTVDRGGQITWHGPGQLVGYPIMKLRKRVDVVAYVRRMEDMIATVCHEFGLTSARGRLEDRTGVWLPADERGPERKICSIGVRVRWATTMHGFALNCNPDMTAFERIAPCAITGVTMTSLSAELGREVTVAEAMPVLERHLPLLLERD
jgi:lipoyl(octanoyl) transferase